ncbi:TraR/DksA family transcriptional regulator [Nocardia sp. NPDC057440]|uniref:TraR/DksA family transcriptional regulator n=1 Tax=Nocardia sp. NPDC057440 TaxID=3346134 RepID=UPI00366BCFF4
MEVVITGPLASPPAPSLDRTSTTNPGDQMAHAHTAARDRLTDHLPVLRATLNQQRRFRLQQLAELEAEIDRATAPTNAADTARHEVTIKLAAAARQVLADIDETLTLITTGRYGRCRRCHAEIPVHLLQIIPTSRWCLNCRQHLTPPVCVEMTHARF